MHIAHLSRVCATACSGEIIWEFTQVVALRHESIDSAARTWGAIRDKGKLFSFKLLLTQQN